MHSNLESGNRFFDQPKGYPFGNILEQQFFDAFVAIM